MDYRPLREPTSLLVARVSIYPTFVSRSRVNREAVRVARIRFHDLRHTHATLALQAGVHPKVVQERLGHSDISITLQTYSHVLPGMQEEAAEQVAALVFRSP